MKSKLAGYIYLPPGTPHGVIQTRTLLRVEDVLLAITLGKQA